MADIDFKAMMMNEGAAMRIGRAEACPTPGETHVYFEPCEESKAVRLADADTQTSGGRVLDVSMTLKNVCPGKRTAVGVTVHEVDQAGNEYPRGFRAVTVPAHNQSVCVDMEMPVQRFILPEDLRVDGRTGCCGGARHFVLRTTVHPVDSTVAL